jgi:phosphatidylserine/phosphatidylglycerophosphate/cardiolipin synthase-like enzyme/uncharacterized membrane protein YdjX (TVP38/TMEM64 family)
MATAVAAPRHTLFDPGRNCVVATHAPRAALLVDSDAYFSAFVAAAQRAERTIIILGWDFDSRARLGWAADESGVPGVLGDFLNFLVRRRRHLNIFVLDWDYPMLFGTERESRPLFGATGRLRPRVHLRYDNTHPVGASHHQKIVVIDDALAFTGGIDLAARRWDTCEHAARDRRRELDGKPYPPVHDAMTVVDGEAARALADIARERWRCATDHPLPHAAPPAADAWPPGLAPDLADVTVAVSRTMPKGSPAGEVREIETLFIDMIGAARHHIYIENQYFTSHAIGDALAARLAGPDPPEIVLITRLLSHGWLEEQTMHRLRITVLDQLRRADAHHRFAVYYPHVPGLDDGTCIDVHSKLMIVDDEWLRVGSANLSNRSMGLDSECDVTFEARGRADTARAIADFRCRLLAEHLDAKPEAVREAFDRTGSLHETIRAFHCDQRSLRTLEIPAEPADAILDLASVADPERPVSMDQLVESFAPDTHAPAKGPAWSKLAVIVVVIAAFALAWRYTALSELLTADRVLATVESLRGEAWAPLAVVVSYSVAAFVLFPRPLLTLVAVMTFGPVLGFVYALLGIVAAALTTYAAGRALPRDIVRRLAGERLNSISERLRTRGVLAVFAVRIVPVAPFAVIGLIAGAVHLKLWQYLAGTLLGMVPGTLATSIFGDQLTVALRDPSRVNYGAVAAVAAAVVILVLVVRRRLAADD